MASRHPDLPDRLQMRLGRSVRSYRRLLDTITREVYAGLRPPSDLVKFSQAAKTGAELLMAENILTRNGGDHEAEEHALGADGGFEAGTAGQYAKKVVKNRSGRDRFGARVDEQVTVIESGVNLQAEDEAEIAAENY